MRRTGQRTEAPGHIVVAVAAAAHTEAAAGGAHIVALVCIGAHTAAAEPACIAAAAAVCSPVAAPGRARSAGPD